MLILIRGAGDLASGIALRLHRCGMKIIMTDVEKPTSIRRTVAFSEAIVHKKTTVEDVTAVYANNTDEALDIISKGNIAVLVDPTASCKNTIKFDVLVDAILAKKNLGTQIDDAPIVIGVGPGFTCKKDCDAYVETLRGHSLGRACYEGSPIPNTNIPGFIGGFSGERVLRAPADGIFFGIHKIGDIVNEGETVGFVISPDKADMAQSLINNEVLTIKQCEELEGIPMKATLNGCLRGLLDNNIYVKKGLKSGDVDPRGEKSYCYTVSDKALGVAGGVLEAILTLSKIID